MYTSLMSRLIADLNSLEPNLRSGRKNQYAQEASKLKVVPGSKVSLPGFDVPETNWLVDGARSEYRLSQADVETGNRSRVKRHQKHLELRCLDTAESA